MNVAIIEDNLSDASALTAFLNQYQQRCSMKLRISLYGSGESFLASSCEIQHLVFMDIYLKQIDGIETARRLVERSPDSLVVFLTGSQEDIWRAVKLHVCFDYVDKSSLNYPRIEEILNTARERLRLRAYSPV